MGEAGWCPFCTSGAFTMHGRNIYRCGDCLRWWTISLRDEPLKADPEAKPRSAQRAPGILARFVGAVAAIMNGGVVVRPGARWERLAAERGR